jgi:dTDP-4-dehydrorhamnose reductase
MPHASWADFAKAIFAGAQRDVTVTGIPASEYPTPAARPSNSRLDCSALTEVFSIPAPDWQSGLNRVLAALG